MKKLYSIVLTALLFNILCFSSLIFADSEIVWRIPEESFKTYKCTQRVIVEMVITDDIQGEIICSSYVAGCPKWQFELNGLKTWDKTLKELSKEGKIFIRYRDTTTVCE